METQDARLVRSALPWVWGRQIEPYELLTPPGGSRCVLFAWSKQEGDESVALERKNTGSPEGRDGG